MTDGNMGFNLLLLGQETDLQRMGRLAAEPWNEKPGRQAGEAGKKTGFRTRLNKLFASQATPDATSEACCCET